ncbi:GntR family transcriptional regulator [Agromyces badenianii]|uniref:GntR family transcriptional regulator n=1 Tax=Agromyces badenianii TaxID=2080742 RepID=A0A2S0WU37_9MICO|nr:GntR family transcriptional regulator [Agromyces badenianii]AWB94811.1 GntR family transcriptional regulator [Agromyces badenianii]PWC03392.1 GntR family transcriptional regulator [Agromyces badenianii]
MTTFPGATPPGFAPPGSNLIGHRTLADTVAEAIHLAILRGEYPAGTWLRIQDLASTYETSSMPVREALRRVAALGLVEVVPHRGARVVELSVSDLEDTYRTRLVLERALVAEAAKTFSAAHEKEAAQALEEHERFIEAGNVDAARRAHTAFHFAIYRASGARWLLRSLEPVWQNSERYRFASPTDPGARRRTHEEHDEILQACSSHDVERAQQAVQVHLNAAMQRINTAMSS